jgi:hypothetical protein
MKATIFLLLFCTNAIIASTPTSTTEMQTRSTSAVVTGDLYPCHYYYFNCLKECRHNADSESECKAGCREQYDACLSN